MTRRELKFVDFAAVRAELDCLQRGYDKAGTWDLAQAGHHLNFFVTGSLDGHQFRVPWLFKVLFGRMVLRRVLSGGKMKTGVFTPQKPLPEPGGDADTAVANLKATLARFDQHQGEFRDSPFFGHLTPDQWRDLHLIHCAHHLAFLIPKNAR
jgi:hypothetical protein